DFDHLWSTLPGDALPPAARAHLATCPLCAAGVRVDAATDAALRRHAAVTEPVDVGQARTAIRSALAAPPAPGSWPHWRRPLALAAGLASAAALAGLLLRPAAHPKLSGPTVVQVVPAPGASSIA